MRTATARTFEDKPATRERVPLFVGLYGPSGSGKTYSALRVAAGIQRVSGGDIFVIDTEAKRSLHYADKFKFRHVEFNAPFSPLDYLAAIEHCVKKGAGVIVIDSLSHEHEGPGGVLEWHEAEVQRMSGGDAGKAERVKMLAWQKPKQARRRLINSILQMSVNGVFCFRAKEKIKIEKGKEPTPLGWMPIAAEEFLYEMTVNALLPPGSHGTPRWEASQPGEEMMIKLPEQFRGLLLEHRDSLSEETGAKMAEWAAGDSAAPAQEELDAVLAQIACSADMRALKTAAEKHGKRPWTAAQRATIKTEIDARATALKNGNASPATREDAQPELPTREPGED